MNSGLLESICTTIQGATGSSFCSPHITPISGGCINDGYQLKSGASSYFVKTNSANHYEMFVTESKALKLLTQCKTLRIPEVICHGTHDTFSFLVLEFLTEEPRSPQFDRQFGPALASLHSITGQTWGLDFDNFVGTMNQHNSPETNWPTFFFNKRLKHQFLIAKKQGYISNSLEHRFLTLGRSIESILPNAAPSLLHGDLWNGNVMQADSMPAIYDPSSYYGDREVDLALTTLFGGFSDDFYASYHETSPLTPGWQNRLKLYTLYPLLVHLNLFGSGYLSQVQQVIHKFS